MARSRSSFDVDGAIATATSLAARPDAKKKRASSVPPPEAPLVRFASRPPPPPSPAEPAPPSGAPPPSAAFDEPMPPSEMPPSSTADTGGEHGLRSALPPSAEDVSSGRGGRIELPSPPSVAVTSERLLPPIERLEDAARELASGRALPRFPELRPSMGPVMRCEKVLEWIATATGASELFLADAAGLPLAGAIRDIEAMLAASGLIASAVGSLVTALPGAPSQRFELHVGEGPFFQLIGFQVDGAAYVVGMMRMSPLSPRQVHAIRIACQHALTDNIGVAR